MRYCSNKDIDQLIQQLIRQGWTYQHRGKHGRLAHPDCRQVLTVAKSPGDYRSLNNFRRDLRKITVPSASA